MKFSTVTLAILSLATLSVAAPTRSVRGGREGAGRGAGDRGFRASSIDSRGRGKAPTVVSPVPVTPPTPTAVAPTDANDETPGSGGNWNVIVDEEDPRSLDQLIAEMGLTVSDLKYVYNNTMFKGFSASLSSHCLSLLTTMSGLKTYEPELEVALLDTAPGTWGLKRISQNTPVTVQTGGDIAAFDFKDYSFEGARNTLGQGVDIYIVDTGINVDHIDFDGRATFGFAFDGQKTDDAGHGTHCAGTAGSTTFGVAKAANLIAVKVLGGTGSGSASDILSGIDWMIQNHEKRSQEANFKGSVASMSLGATVRSTTMDLAVQKANAAGIHFSVAAGNENQDSCNSSPAFASRGTDVLSVGAINILDERASFSNFGQCVSVYAPGEDVTSTWIGGPDIINTISGTSMACPHISGLIAYHLGLNASLATDTAAVKKIIVGSSLPISIDKNFARNKDPSILANNGILKQ